jgi:hypothetical protein
VVLKLENHLLLNSRCHNARRDLLEVVGLDLERINKTLGHKEEVKIHSDHIVVSKNMIETVSNLESRKIQPKHSNNSSRRLTTLLRKKRLTIHIIDEISR